MSTVGAVCAQLDPLVELQAETVYVVDLSAVRIWDISALLWFGIALRHYRDAGLALRLRLPDPQWGRSKEEAGLFQRSADFLRRWRFDVALSHSGDVADVLVSEQSDFFSLEKQVFYKARTIVNARGVEEELLSRRLMEIRDMTEYDSASRTTEVSQEKINAYIRHLQDAQIGDILHRNCGIPAEDAKCFAEHLVSEGLLNMEQHPQADMGMIGLATLPMNNELIIGIADNGESIASTILESYNQAHDTQHDGEWLSASAATDIAQVIDYATQPHVSRKDPDPLDPEHGMGLTYIKRDATEKFAGRVRLVTQAVQVDYKQTPAAYSSAGWPQSFTGNLLRISIPLAGAASRQTGIARSSLG